MQPDPIHPTPLFVLATEFIISAWVIFSHSSHFASSIICSILKGLCDSIIGRESGVRDSTLRVLLPSKRTITSRLQIPTFCHVSIFKDPKWRHDSGVNQIQMHSDQLPILQCIKVTHRASFPSPHPPRPWGGGLGIDALPVLARAIQFEPG